MLCINMSSRGQKLELMTRLLPPDMAGKIMGFAPEQYIKVCSLNKKLSAQLAPFKLEDPMRDYALQHFVEVAPHLSRVQVVDLMEDNMLPWAEERVLAASKAWEKCHPSEKPLTEHIRHGLLNPQQLGQARLVPRLNIPWAIVKRETVKLASDTRELCAWGEHLVSRSCRNQLVFIFSNADRSSSATPFMSFRAEKLQWGQCMLVHGDLLYIGDKTGDVFVFHLPDGRLHSELKSTKRNLKRSEVCCLAHSADYLWVAQDGGDIAVWSGTNLLHDNFENTAEYSISCVYDLKASGNYAFCSCDYKHYNEKGSHGILVLCASDGTIHMRLAFGTGTRTHLAVLDNRMLCAGTSQGQIHAWALDAVLTPLWRLQLQLPCSCLETRGTQLLYGGITQDESSNMFEVVDDTGNTVHTEASPLYIRHIVSTRAAVYVRSGCGDLECWRA